MKSATKKYRFQLHSIDEIWRMPHEEWDRQCRLSGADFTEHPEEAAIREEHDQRKKEIQT
jgi:hypothetical protein